MPKLFQAAARPALRGRPAGESHGPARSPRRPVAVEPLEGRRLWSVALDAGGWTVVTPPTSARVVYVSSSAGSDANDGLSPSRPVKSLARAESLVRDGAGDQLLLKRGDAWAGGFGAWDKGGRDAGSPLVIGAYGAGDRPLLLTGAANGFSTSGRVDHLALIGLAFRADARDPASPTFRSKANCTGIQVFARTDGLLIEDCAVDGYGNNVVLQDVAGPIRNVTVRRSVITDAYNVGGANAQGLYAEGVDGLTLEGNVFDHNGWDDAAGAVATIFNHNVYVHSSCTGFVARGNVFANAASHGLQARAGGDVQDNAFLDNPLGLSYGLVNGSPAAPGGVAGVVNGNVFVGTRDIDGAVRGIGMQLGNTRPGGPTVVSNNIFSTDTQLGSGGTRSLTDGSGSPAIMLERGRDLTNPGDAVGLNDLTLQGNVVYRWSGAVGVEGGMQPGGSGQHALNRIEFRDNDFQRIRNRTIVRHDAPLDATQETWAGGRYDGVGAADDWVTVGGRGMAFDRWADKGAPAAKATRASYVAADRTAATYAGAMLGTASTTADFLAAARVQSNQAWDANATADALVAYVRAGFDEVGRPARDWRAPTPPTATVAFPAAVTTNDAGLTFTVTYADDGAIDVDSLRAAAVRVTGPGGYAHPATLVSVTGGGDDDPAVATYTLPARRTVWRKADQGRYVISVDDPAAVRDADGFALKSDRLGEAKLEVTPVPPPPVVQAVKVRPKGPHRVDVRFSSDVSASLTPDDLLLTTADGATAVDPAATAVAWDPARRTATWIFPGLPGAALPAGTYRVTVRAAGTADADARPLDGNKDGLGGDDFVSAKAYLVRR